MAEYEHMKPDTPASADPLYGGKKNSRHSRSVSFASNWKRSASGPKVNPCPSGPAYVFRCFAMVLTIRYCLAGGLFSPSSCVGAGAAGRCWIPAVKAALMIRPSVGSSPVIISAVRPQRESRIRLDTGPKQDAPKAAPPAVSEFVFPRTSIAVCAATSKTSSGSNDAARARPVGYLHVREEDVGVRYSPGSMQVSLPQATATGHCHCHFPPHSHCH